MVPMFWVAERGSHHLKLSWMSPFEINGVLTGYIISHREGSKPLIKDASSVNGPCSRAVMMA